MSDELAPEFGAGAWSLAVPNTRVNIHNLRIHFERYARNVPGGSDAFADDITLAVGEALANAAEHGHRSNGTVTLEAVCTAEGMEITVSDDGPGFAPHPHAVPDAYGPRGFGIHIMRSLADVVEFRDGGRRVYLFKRLPG